MAKLEEIAKNIATEGKSPDNADNRNNRKQRVPFGTPRGKLDVEGKEAGFEYFWVNDDKVDQRLDEGLEFVTHDVKVGTRKVGAVKASNGSICVTIPVGAGQVGYLMRLPKELYDADMKRYNKDVVDKTEESMRKDLKKNNLSGTFELSRKSD